MQKQDFVLIANSYSKPFADKVSHYLKTHPDTINFKQDIIADKLYADGSRFTQLGTSVRGNKVFVIHNHSIGQPDQTNYDLLLIADALKRANDEGFMLCQTYLNARGDKKDEGRVPIPSKLFADCLQTAGGHNLKRYITSHLHAEQITGFFDIPVDNLPSLPLFGWYIKRHLFKEYYDNNTHKENLAVLSPDSGSVQAAKEAASYLELPLAKRQKSRTKYKESPGESQTEQLQLSENIKDRHVLVFDDIMDTGGTLITASADLKEKYGAKSVYFLPTHLVASPKQDSTAEEKLQAAKSQPKIITTDTIQRSDDYIKENSSWLKCVMSMAPLFAESIYRQINAMSVTGMYKSPEIFEKILDTCFEGEGFTFYNRENDHTH